MSKCENPLLARRGLEGGLYQIFGPFRTMYYIKDCHPDWDFMLLPCGDCLSCRMRRAREWSLRCKHEEQLHEHSCFVTLTYNDDHLPLGPDGSPTLCRDHYQRFFKRLRKALGCKIRYFGCGEYGLENSRPHYHFIIFGWCPTDCSPIHSHDGVIVYESPFLDRLWAKKGVPIGFVSVGEVTDASIKYVARYQLKKLEQNTDGFFVKPFVVASNRPGIGAAWFEKYQDDCVKISSFGEICSCNCLDGNILVSMPRYYRKCLARSDPELSLKVDAAMSDIVASAHAVTPADIERLRRFNAAKIRKYKQDHT